MGDERPLSEYAGLTAAFGAVLGGFLLLAGRRLPDRITFGDTARIGLASYKIGRLVAKDEVTSWMRAPVTRDAEASEPKPQGLERALGELVTCPYCVGVWAASGLSYALVLYPRQTRLVTTIFGAQAVADFLNAAFVKLKEDKSGSDPTSPSWTMFVVDFPLFAVANVTRAVTKATS